MSEDEYNVNELGFQLGYISALNNVKGKRKKKHPLGFAPPATPPRKPRGQRKPGTFPDVPHFDIQEP